jgi:AraC-like DNA-binding protein
MRHRTKTPAPPEQASFWRHDGPDGAEFLIGRYRQFTFAPHAHDRYLFALIAKGALEIIEPRRSATAAAGQVVLYGHDQVHWGRSAHREGWSILSIYLPPSYVDQAAQELGAPLGGTIGFPNIVNDDQQLARRIAMLCSPVEAASGALATESKLLAVLGDVLTRHADRRVKRPAVGRESRRTRIAREFIDHNYASNVSLRELSALSGVGRYWLIKAFKAAYGVPPHAYLTSVRVRQAQRLLRDGMEIAEAAVACGFADQSHLSRSFKRSTALTPGRFKLGNPRFLRSSTP